MNSHLNKLRSILPRVPSTIGIYVMKNQSGQIIYIGKSINLKDRLSQYLTLNQDALGSKTRNMVSDISVVSWKETLNEFDALLLEAQMIRTHQPKYNILAKDDKSPLYVQINMADKLPIVKFARKQAIQKEIDSGSKYIFGPFQSSRMARKIMSDLRKIIPFCTQKFRSGKPCFYTHIGLCNPCPSYISKLQDPEVKIKLTALYRSQINRICQIMSGKSKILINRLYKQMTEMAQAKKFEQAAIVRNQINRLNQLQVIHLDPMNYIQSDSAVENTAFDSCQDLYKILNNINQGYKYPKIIECIDISNLSDTGAVGSLTAVVGGLPDKSRYRRFQIRTVKGQNDAGMIAEVVRRRFKHIEWEFPDLLVIDGGKPQLKSAQNALNEIKCHIPIIGIAKRFENIMVFDGSKIVEIMLPHNNPALHLIQMVRDEAHRFALSYQKKVRKSIV